MSATRSRPAPGATVVMVLPVVISLVLVSWLMWVRADPSRSGGFCATATVDLSEILEQLHVDDHAGSGLVPDPALLLDAARSIELERIEAVAPPEIRGDLALLSDAVRSRRTASSEGNAVDPRVLPAMARVFVSYRDHCK